MAFVFPQTLTFSEGAGGARLGCIVFVENVLKRNSRDATNMKVCRKYPELLSNFSDCQIR